MKHIVCLTKTYNFADFYKWFEYHKKMGYAIHVIDNESPDSMVNECFNLLKTPVDTYETLSGWPNQWQLFDDILKENRYKFADGDFVAFIDDDEYIWFYHDYWKLVEKHNPEYKGKKYDTVEEYLDRCLKSTTTCVALMPQILMSTPDVVEERTVRVYEHSLFRRNDKTAQGKVFIKYDHTKTYQFNHDLSEKGHVPLVNGSRISVVNGVGVSTSTYGNVDPTACLRLYHYHIKSLDDWEKKWNRGSAAVDHQWYDAEIKNNKNFGGYIIPDFTMLETIKLANV